MSGRLGKMWRSTREENVSRRHQIRGLFALLRLGRSSTRDKNFREGARARDVRFLSGEEPPEQTYGDHRGEHAKFRDEAARSRGGRNNPRERNKELRGIDGSFMRRIMELINEVESLKAELGEQRKTGGSLGANLASVQKENGSLNTTITVLRKEHRSLDTTIAGLLEQNRSLKTTITELQKGNRSLDATNRSLDTTIAGFQEEKKHLDWRARELNGENEIVKRKNEELRSWVTKLEHDLREVQEREYAAAKQQDIESHEVVSAQFEKLFRRCESWARRYFKLGVGDFRIAEFPPFAHELDLVSWSDTNWKGKKYFKLSHLVQAVLGNILVRKVFECPFAGCSRDFRREFRGLYEFKLRVEGEQAAHRWRASSLSTYHQCENWPPGGGPPMATYRRDNLKEIENCLDEVLSPITAAYFQDRAAEDSSSQGNQLLAIINDAMALAAKMSQQASKLVVIDMEWLQKNGRKLDRNDDRMKDRLGDGDDNPEADLTVDLILTPGFLKHGNDDAEHLDQYSVWMPAKVDIRGRHGGNPPLTSGETEANEQVEIGGGQDFTQGPLTGLSEDRSDNGELPAKEGIL